MNNTIKVYDWKVYLLGMATFQRLDVTVMHMENEEAVRLYISRIYSAFQILEIIRQ